MGSAPTDPIVVDDPRFGVWARPHVAVMRRFIASHAPVQDSDDILQEALARAWRRWSTYSPEKGSPRAWLLAIALDQSRRAAARGKQLYLLPDSSAFER